MDDISEKTAQQASESDEEIIDLVEEVSDTTSEDDEEIIELTETVTTSEDDEEIIELTETVEEAPSEAVAPPTEGQEEGPDPGVEYKDVGETDLLADLGMELETGSESKEARIDPEIIASQFSKEELEALVTRAAKDAISEIAERIVTKEAEQAILKEIERIKSALK